MIGVHRHAVIGLVTTPESALTASSLYSLLPRLRGYETIVIFMDVKTLMNVLN